MANSTSRIDAVIADLDALNATDPRLETDCDRQRPRELVYAERMTACLARVYPDASENLGIAARAQHVCRWQILRSGFPLGRDGYNAWRVACREHHSTLAVRIMQRHGYGSGDIQQVAKIIKKEDLKRDGESQALENVAAVVFVQFYMSAFATDHPDYDEEKLAGIVRKTLRKMDALGHAAVLALPLTPHAKRIVDLAMTGRS